MRGKGRGEGRSKKKPLTGFDMDIKFGLLDSIATFFFQSERATAGIAGNSGKGARSLFNRYHHM